MSDTTGTRTSTGQQIDVPPEYYDQNDSDDVCFVCEDPHYHLFRRVTHYGFPFEFKRCQCGIIKQTPIPNRDFFEWFFNSNLFFSAKQADKKEIWGFYDYFKDEPSRMATSQRRYHKLEKYFEGTGPLDVMKIGPSTGTFLHVAQNRGHRVLGCDISERFVGYARDNYDVQIDHGRFETMDYQAGQFDRVLLFNVIENVPNQTEFLSAIHRTLKPGGLFILNFVNEENNLVSAIQKDKYFLYRPPICYTFTEPVMKRVLAKFGFEVIEDIPDVRYMHIEKMVTLLGWHGILNLATRLGIHDKPFPIYAYPSRVLVARRG